MDVQLPQPYRNILGKYFSGIKYTIKKAYMDRKEADPKNGVQDLRKFLNLSDNDSCCDFYAVCQSDEGEWHILMEDKATDRSKEVQEGINQLSTTHQLITSQDNSLKDQNKWLAFMCNAKYNDPITQKTISGKKCKVLINKMSGKPITLRSTDIVVFASS